MYSNKLATALFTLLLLSGQGGHAGSPAAARHHQHGNNNNNDSGNLEKRQTQYCDAASGICYLEYSRGPSTPTFRIAVPEAAAPPFDTLLQITAPAALGWAGFAWGGGMTYNPLTVAWPDGGDGVTVSSRWSTGRTLPDMYPSATYRTLSASRNDTHWTVETVCTGCSSWSGGGLSTTGVNTFAWASSEAAVADPGNPASSFAIHTNVGMFSGSLADATVPRDVFEEYVRRGGQQ